MSRVITLSQSFPAYHPKAGEETFFVQKFLTANRVTVHSKPNEPTHFYPDPQDLFELNKHLYHDLVSKFVRKIDGYSDKFEPKHHTIRSGNRWKVGDKFSPRVWSCKPYQSKQIIISPDLEVKKVWEFEIKNEFEGDGWYNMFYINGEFQRWNDLEKLAKNDGLILEDLIHWFKANDGYFSGKEYKCEFNGQIICWSDSVNYNK